MKISKNFFLTVLCLVLVCGAVFAAGNRQATTGTTVTLWHFPTSPTVEKFYAETLPAAVKAKYPNITLRAEMLPYETGPERMTVAFATRSTPDIIVDGEARLNPAIFAGLAADVSDLRKEFAPLMYDGFDSVGKINGVHYYVPTMVEGIYNITVNIDMAKELGVYNMLPADHIHWSYDDFLNLCRATRNAGRSKGIYPLELWAGSNSADSAYYSWILSGGANIINADHSAMTVNSPEAARTLNIFKQLIDEGLVPDGYVTTVANNLPPAWVSKKTMMVIHSAGTYFTNLITTMGKNGEADYFNADVYCYPTPDGKRNPRTLSWGTGGLSIFKNSNNATVIEAAKNVVRTLMNDVKLYEESITGASVDSINKNVKLDTGNAYVNERANMTASWAGFGDASVGILEPWWPSWREIFYVELQEFYRGRQTVQQLLTNWTTKGNEVIKNYKP